MQVLHGAHVLLVVHAMAAVSAKTAHKKGARSCEKHLCIERLSSKC
jgi:hypothetical protein